METADQRVQRAFMQAVMEAFGPKKAERIIRSMALRLAREESVSDALPIRRHPSDAVNRREATRANERVRSWLPAFLAGLR